MSMSTSPSPSTSPGRSHAVDLGLMSREELIVTAQKLAGQLKEKKSQVANLEVALSESDQAHAASTRQAEQEAVRAAERRLRHAFERERLALVTQVSVLEEDLRQSRVRSAALESELESARAVEEAEEETEAEEKKEEEEQKEAVDVEALVQARVAQWKEKVQSAMTRDRAAAEELRKRTTDAEEAALRLVREKDTLAEAVAHLTEQLAQMQSALKLAEEEKNSALAAAAAASAESEATATTIAKGEEVESLREQLAARAHEVEDLTAALAQSREQESQSRRETEERETLREELESAKLALEAAETTVSELRALLTRKENDWGRECEALTAELSELRGQAEGSAARAAAAEQSLSRVTVERDTLKAERDAAPPPSSLLQQSHGLQAQVAKCTSELLQARTALMEKDKIISELVRVQREATEIVRLAKLQQCQQ